MGLMDDTPTGKLIRTILLAFAEFERNMIIEKTQEGRKISGNLGGRPHKYNEDQIKHALELLNNYSYSQVSKMAGISISTIYRATQKIKAKKTYTINLTNPAPEIRG